MKKDQKRAKERGRAHQLGVVETTVDSGRDGKDVGGRDVAPSRRTPGGKLAAISQHARTLECRGAKIVRKCWKIKRESLPCVFLVVHADTHTPGLFPRFLPGWPSFWILAFRSLLILWIRWTIVGGFMALCVARG